MGDRGCARSPPRWWYCGRRRTIELLEDRVLRVVVRLLRVEECHVLIARVVGAFRERLLSSLAPKMPGIPGRPEVQRSLDRRKASGTSKVDARDELKALAWALSRAFELICCLANLA